MIPCSLLYSYVKCINQRFPAEFPGHHPLVLQFLQAGGLMAGAAPTATRAMALNFGMLAFNASAKATSGCGFLPFRQHRKNGELTIKMHQICTDSTGSSEFSW